MGRYFKCSLVGKYFVDFIYSQEDGDQDGVALGAAHGVDHGVGLTGAMDMGQVVMGPVMATGVTTIAARALSL